MKNLRVVFLLFGLLITVIFSEEKVYKGTGVIIFYEFGCPEAPEYSTCAGYRFISDSENFQIDASSWGLIKKADIKSGDKAEVDGYIQEFEKTDEIILTFYEPVLKIRKIVKIE